MISENIPRNSTEFTVFDIWCFCGFDMFDKVKNCFGWKGETAVEYTRFKTKNYPQKKCIQTHFWISGSKQRKQRKTSTTYIFCCNYSIHKIVIGEFPFHAVWTLHSDRVNFLFLHLPIVYGTIECARIPPWKETGGFVRWWPGMFTVARLLNE